MGAGGKGRQGPLRKSSSAYPPQKRRRPTVIFTFTVENFPGDRTRRMWARGMPMNASAPMEDRLSTSFCRPMPGSIITGIAPTRKRAKVTANSSREGRTMRMVFTPRTMPARWKPWARRSVSSSSWRNVQWTKAPEAAGQTTAFFSGRRRATRLRCSLRFAVASGLGVSRGLFISSTGL